MTSLSEEMLFQNEGDWHTVSELSSMYSIDLDCRADHVEPSERGEKDMTMEQARALLDGGVVAQAFQEMGSRTSADLCMLFIFSAKAMEIGARFTDMQLNYLRSRIPMLRSRVIFYPIAVKQLELALGLYPNDGTPFDLAGPWRKTETTSESSGAASSQPKSLFGPFKDEGKGKGRDESMQVEENTKITVTVNQKGEIINVQPTPTD